MTPVGPPTDSLAPSPAHQRWRWIAGGVVLLCAGATVGWAATVILTPAKDILAAAKYTTVKVVEGEVGSSINLNSVAEWTPVPVGSNQASGVVTTSDLVAGTEVGQGAILFTVNLRPIVVARGEIPAFGAIGEGSNGADVAQIQTLLGDLGFYNGARDGKAGHRTASAIRAWQTSLGVNPTGVVEIGDVIFLPKLPSRVALDATVIKRGASVSGGEQVVQGLPASPAFTIPVTEKQAALMPSGTRVQITSPKGTEWIAFAGDQSKDENGSIVVKLEGANGTSVCGDECGQLTITGNSLLQSRILTVELVKGAVVPAAALLTDASGAVAVVDGEGGRHPVSVVASARGMAVITGVDLGMRVRIPTSSIDG